MKRPKLIRDWKNGYVKALFPVANRLGELPAGTFFKVTSSGARACLESLPCHCCGFKLAVAIYGKNKFTDFVWLGYEKPEISNPPRR